MKSALPAIVMASSLFNLIAGSVSFAQGTKKPNVVLIIADDLGYGDIGAFGQKLIRTPNLDRMAAEGMKLTHHYSGNAVCAPSRCVLMTGKHPGHAFIRNNRTADNVKGNSEVGKPEFEGQYPIPVNELTMAELFQSFVVLDSP